MAAEIFFGIYFASLCVLFLREAIFIYDEWRYDEVDLDFGAYILYFVPIANTFAALVALFTFSFWIFGDDR